MLTEGDLTLDDKHIIQYIDDALQNHTRETYVILLTNITPINSKKFWCKKMQTSKEITLACQPKGHLAFTSASHYKIGENLFLHLISFS